MNRDVEKALIAVLKDEAGVTEHRIVPGGKHPKLVFSHNGTEHHISFSRSPGDPNAAANAAKGLRETLGLPKPARTKNPDNRGRTRNKTAPAKPDLTLTDKPDWRADLPALSRITKPGVYDISAEQYHAFPGPTPTPSLSQSTAKLLQPFDSDDRISPYRVRHQLENPPDPSEAMVIGSAAHEWTLEGETWPLRHAVLPEDHNGRTKIGKELVADIVADGKRPVTFEQFAQITAMKKALEAHPFAMSCFRNGAPEKSLYWYDEEFAIWRRARLDWQPHGRGGDGVTRFADLKTIQTVTVAAIRKAILNFGYFQQAAWYLDGIEMLGLAEKPAFLFVFQEKTPPFEVAVVEIEETWIGWGRILNRKAMERWADGIHNNHWPMLLEEPETITPPYWAEQRMQRQQEAGAFEDVYRVHAPMAAE